MGAVARASDTLCRTFRCSKQGLFVERTGLLRRKRIQEIAEQSVAAPATVTSPTSPPDAAAPQLPEAARPLRQEWASGAFLAAAARLVARGEETTYTLRRVVEWATAATGARRAVLWALEEPEAGEYRLVQLAWAATDGWQPADLPDLPLQSSPAVLRASRTAEVVIVIPDRPQERGAAWDARLGLTPIALCAAISAGKTRGILAVAGLNTEQPDGASFREDAQAALVACAALAAIVFERQREKRGAPPHEPATTALPTASVQSTATTPFTALPDYAAMCQRLNEEIGRVRRFKHPLAVLVLDIDRFESWVERIGQVRAEALRSYLVRLVRESIREVDLIGRGEDGTLIIILPISGIDDALRVGERIRAIIANRQPGELAPEGLRLTISGGAVGFPDDGVVAETLLAAATQTLAYARRMGRDQIRMRGLADMEPLTHEVPHHTQSPASMTLEAPRIAQVFHALLNALALAGDAHDQARTGHGQAVGRYAGALATACGLHPDQARIIQLAGILHDVGKIGLPAAVLGKRGELTPEERAILREQPMVGKLMLLQIPALEAIIPLVEHAHERYDGHGYPQGLQGNQIPFGSRLIAIAEGFDAMTNERPYRRALSQHMAITELRREAGGHYDPQLVDTFVQLLGSRTETTVGEGWSAVPFASAATETSTPAAPREGTTLRHHHPEEQSPLTGGGAASTLRAAEQLEGHEAEIEWYNESVTSSASTEDSVENAAVTTDEERVIEQGPEHSTVEETILMMSQTTLLRLAELERPNKRPTGTLYRNPKRAQQD